MNRLIAGVLGVAAVSLGIVMGLLWFGAIVALINGRAPLGIAGEGWALIPEGGPAMFFIIAPLLAYVSLRFGHGLLHGARR